MIVTADDVARSVRGTVELMNRRIEGVKAFDMSEAGFWRSFGAIWLTLPAFVVLLALERHRLGLLAEGAPLLDLSRLTAVVALGHVAAFLAMPLAMIGIARRLGLSSRYVPFVIVTNWIVAIEFVALAVPGSMLLVGWATPGLAAFFALCFLVIVLRIHWFAAKATLGVSGAIAAGIAVFGLGLNLAIAGVVDVLAG